jgi:YD repeat-containing protein
MMKVREAQRRWQSVAPDVSRVGVRWALGALALFALQLFLIDIAFASGTVAPTTPGSDGTAVWCEDRDGNTTQNGCARGPSGTSYAGVVAAVLQRQVDEANAASPGHNYRADGTCAYTGGYGKLSCALTGHYTNYEIGPPPQTYTINWATGASLFSYCVGNTPPTTFVDIYTYTCPVNPPVCPANSTVAASTCICNIGYAPNGSATACVAAVAVPRTLNPPSCPADQGQGNPIHPLRAVKREPVDLGVRVGATSLILTYDSTPLIPKTPASLAGSEGVQIQNYGVLGKMWSANLFKQIATTSVRTSAGVSPGAAQVSRGNGVTITMGQNVTSGQYSAEANTADTLVSIAGGSLRYYDSKANTEETYNSAGQLTAQSWASGQSLSLTYSDANTPSTIAPGAGYLIQAIDNSGRIVSFSYTARTSPLVGAQLSSITDAAGQVITLSYDGANNMGNLTGVHWSDGKSKTFLYENNPYGALTGISDELNQRYATFGYDTEWRAISSEHAGGVDHYSASYTTPPYILITEQYDSTADAVFRYYDWQLPQGTVVTGPNGQTSDWSATSLLNKNYLTGQSQPAGSGCAASSSALSYDTNGNVASSDDFNGSRSCSAYDLSRNLETTRVEGLVNTQACSAVTGAGASLPIGSRKTSTSWHPDWKLEAKRAEPGKLTTSIYNGQPDPFNGGAVASCAPSTALLPDGKPIAVLCKQVEQATSDANGSQGFSASLQSGVVNRTRSWTYNSTGQVLTEKDPLNNTTTYTYYTDTTADHTLGDLQGVTNAKNQVTTYGKYNKHGQLLESTDPNGVVTTNTYDLRQRLLSTSVGGQTTSYEYDAAGQLTKVTSPDASWVGYEYDAAHRQSAVKDNLGNRIEYVLDNAGNKTGQSVKDPQGNLARSLARSIDALGRVEQTMGRE